MKQKSVISSLSNSQIKNLTLLQKKSKARDEQGVFVIEGLKMYEEAKELGVLNKAYVSESFYQDMIFQQADYFDGVDYEILTDSVFKGVSETQTPQGVMGLVAKSNFDLDALLKEPNACFLLLEDIRDPGNLGTMIRTAEGAGITGIIANSSTVDIYNPKVVRSTMGSIYRVPFIIAENFYDIISRLKQHNIQIYAAHLAGIDYDTEGNYGDKCAFMIGNEANGLSEQATKYADRLIKIPMAGKVESLNAAVAAAILMYEAARQRKSNKS